MIQSPQTITIAREGAAHDASVSWRYERGGWVVELTCAAFDPVHAQADDAFEALCTIREQVEPHGWRIGVAGAQADVWPSGMSRDQGGGLVVYRMTSEGAAEILDTFAPVNPDSVVDLAEQRAEIDRLFAEISHGNG